MSEYELGQRVAITGTAQKIHAGDRTRYKESELPFRDYYPNRKTFTEGVIVGARTVIEGERWFDDYGRNFSPTPGTGRRVWLVAFDMRMKPVMCFDHQVNHQTEAAPDGAASSIPEGEHYA